MKLVLGLALWGVGASHGKASCNLPENDPDVYKGRVKRLPIGREYFPARSKCSNHSFEEAKKSKNSDVAGATMAQSLQLSEHPSIHSRGIVSHLERSTVELGLSSENIANLMMEICERRMHFYMAHRMFELSRRVPFPGFSRFLDDDPEVKDPPES